MKDNQIENIQSQPETYFLHVDINAYFATMLQQENPRLRNQPVGIVKSEGRTCIIAASKEAKKLGVKTGMSRADAQQLCPQLIIVPAVFSLYSDTTHRFIYVLQKLTPNVEVFSLDEAFIRFQNQTAMWKTPEYLAEQIQKEIKRELGSWVTCNIGIASTRILAKMAGETAEKGSIRTISPDQVFGLLASTSFEDTCGIGRGLTRKLRHLGITQPLQLLLESDDQLRSLVGGFWAKELKKMAQGLDPEFLKKVGESQVNEHTVKSISRSITLLSLSDTDHEILATLQNLTQEAVYKLRRLHLSGRFFSISLEGSHQMQKTERKRAYITTKTPFCHLEKISMIVRSLYKSIDRTIPVIRCRVVIGLLEPSQSVQPSLFDTWFKHESVNLAIESIQERYGIYSISSARMISSEIIQPEVTGYLGDKAFFFRNH